jgi:hypothetical protein
MLDGLRRILETACELRDSGRLSILPMAGIVNLMNQAEARVVVAPDQEGVLTR